jgi:hypothetical protein
MSRPVIQLHTIPQWLAVAPEVRSVILQNLKMKDRLYRYLQTHRQKPALPDGGIWKPCWRCDKRGYVHVNPRHAGIHPSQLPHPCLLKIYWQMEGREEREVVDNRKLLIFDLGTAVHQMFQAYGMNGAWGERYIPEIHMTEGSHPLATELMIEGHADADNILIVDDIPHAPIYEVGCVHEYKTIKTENFNKLTRPLPKHLDQAMIYSGVLNRPVTIYLYLSKNDQNLSDFPVEFNPETWGRMAQKAKVLISYYEREVEPPASPGYHCKECGFMHACAAYQAFSTQRVAARR